MDPITIFKKYAEIKAYYDDDLNKNKDLVKTSNDEPTPIDCVEEMFSKIPLSVLQNPNLKWLDPCCGCGNFSVVAFNMLSKYHDPKHILENMLYFNDTNADRLEIVRQVFCANKYALNITMMSFLDYNVDVRKYDLILANPPYAKLLENGKRASKNHNMIGSFIRKSLEILEPGGHLVYITPDNWMSCADRNTLIRELTEKQILYLNIHTAKKYFKKVGSSFTWYIIENVPHYKDIVIEGIRNKTVYVDHVKSESRSYIPLYYNRNVQTILSKTIDCCKHEKFEVLTTSDLHKYTKKIHIRDEQDEEFRYRLIHTPKQTVWANRAHKFQDGFKVFLGTTSYYNVFVDNCGMTQSIAFIRCEDEAEAKKYARVLGHPLYKFINNICRWGNFNNVRIMQAFPKCDDYDAVYSKFGISADEIQFIEECV